MSLFKKLVENWKKRSVTKKLSIKGTNDWKVYFKSNITRWERRNDITNARSSSAKNNWDFLVVFFASLFSRALFWSSISLGSLLSFSYLVSAAALTLVKKIERSFSLFSWWVVHFCRFCGFRVCLSSSLRFRFRLLIYITRFLVSFSIS
jgi:hypothetical protein